MADYVEQRDKVVMQALVTAGAFVALADGRVKLGAPLRTPKKLSTPARCTDRPKL